MHHRHAKRDERGEGAAGHRVEGLARFQKLCSRVIVRKGTQRTQKEKDFLRSLRSFADTSFLDGGDDVRGRNARQRLGVRQPSAAFSRKAGEAKRQKAAALQNLAEFPGPAFKTRPQF
jgi:hypothetical protein